MNTDVRPIRIETINRREFLFNGSDVEPISLCHALRNVPLSSFATLLPYPQKPKPDDIVLVKLDKIGKNGRLELVDGRPRTLYVGDLLAMVFGNRYATNQFEGYARAKGDTCEILSMGGLCGLVESKHANVREPSKLRMIGAFGDAQEHPLNLRDFGLPRVYYTTKPRIVAVCGTSMDSGKTYTAKSIIAGLRKSGSRVAGIKLTGTATGRDTWQMQDAGAFPTFDFIDGGFASTYLLSLDELLDLANRLFSQAAAQKAEYIVVEIADGLLQRETAALLKSSAFVNMVDAWVFAASESMAAVEGVRLLRSCGIEPMAISGVVSMSPLGMRETEAETGVPCFTAGQLQSGKMNEKLMAKQTDIEVIS
jgi:hypothetical protein